MNRRMATTMLVCALALRAEVSFGAMLSDKERMAFAEWFGRIRCENFFERYREGELALPWFIVVADFDLDGDGAPEIVMYNGMECGTGGAVWHFFRKSGSAWEDIEQADGLHAMARWESYLWVVETADGRCRLSSNSPQFSADESSLDAVREEIARFCGVESDWAGAALNFRIQNVRHWVEGDGLLHSDESTNGVTQMLLDPGFRHLERVRLQRFDGTNFIHSTQRPPAWPELSEYRLCNETNSVDAESRAGLAEAFLSFGTPATNALAVFVDVNSDGRLDAVVADENDVDDSGWLHWRLFRSDDGGWVPAQAPTCPSQGVGPEIPPSFRAGTNDLYRVWISTSDSIFHVFVPTGVGKWDVRSPFSESETPERMREALRLGDARINYEDWSAIFGMNPPRDFYQLFEPGSPMIQLDRLLPEKLLP